MAVQLNDLYASTLVRGQKLYTDYEYKYFDARTNLLKYSQEFDNEAWVPKTETTVTANYATAPNGTQTADRIVGTGTTYNTNRLYQTVTGLPDTLGVAYVYSVWLRATAQTNLKLKIYCGPDSGGLTKDVVVTPQWQRFELQLVGDKSATTVTVNIGNYEQTNPFDVEAWGAQLETGSEATWYIPTTSATVTKPAGVYSRRNPLLFKRAALWGASTNKVTCRKVNPTDTSNITKSGDAAATLSVVEDTAALAAAGLDKICTSGNVYKLDNSGGSTRAFATLSGGTTTAAHVYSAYCRVGSGSGYLSNNQNGQDGNETVFSSSAYSRKENIRATSISGSLLQVVAQANSVVYFILPQLEESPYCTPPIFQDSNGDDPLTSLTRPATLCEAGSAGILRGNNIALMGQVIPGATQSLGQPFSTQIVDSDRAQLTLTADRVFFTKRIAASNIECSTPYFNSIGVPFQYQAYLSSTYGMGIRVRYWLGMAWSAWTAWATNTNTQDAPIAETFEIGSRNDTNRFDGNYQMFRTYWSADPKAWLESQG